MGPTQIPCALHGIRVHSVYIINADRRRLSPSCYAWRICVCKKFPDYLNLVKKKDFTHDCRVYKELWHLVNFYNLWCRRIHKTTQSSLYSREANCPTTKSPTQNTHAPSVFTKTVKSYLGCLVNGHRERHVFMPSAPGRPKHHLLSVV